MKRFAPRRRLLKNSDGRGLRPARRLLRRYGYFRTVIFFWKLRPAAVSKELKYTPLGT